MRCQIIYIGDIYTDITIRSARQNAVLPGRTPFCPAERRSAGQNNFRDTEVPHYIYRRYIYGYYHSFCPAEHRSAGQNDFRDLEVPDYIYRRYIYGYYHSFCPAERHSARQNAVLPGRTIFATRRCQTIYIGDIYMDNTIRSARQNAVLPGRTPFATRR